MAQILPFPRRRDVFDPDATSAMGACGVRPQSSRSVASTSGG